MSEPRQKPHRSKQDYGTPWDFIRAVEARFALPRVGCSSFDIDLAASAENAKANEWLGLDNGRDAFSFCWSTLDFRNAWLNPPFGIIEPFAARCAPTATPRRRIFMLTPASIGTEWFAAHVHQKALVLGLSPRLTFQGTTDPYPKDLMLSVFGEFPGFGVWRWKS